MLRQEAGIAPARTDVVEAKSTRRDRRQTQRGSQYLAAAFAMGAVEDEDIGQIGLPVTLSSYCTQSGLRSSTPQCSIPARPRLETIEAPHSLPGWRRGRPLQGPNRACATGLVQVAVTGTSPPLRRSFIQAAPNSGNPGASMPAPLGMNSVHFCQVAFDAGQGMPFRQRK